MYANNAEADAEAASLLTNTKIIPNRFQSEFHNPWSIGAVQEPNFNYLTSYNSHERLQKDYFLTFKQCFDNLFLKENYIKY